MGKAAESFRDIITIAIFCGSILGCVTAPQPAQPHHTIAAPREINNFRELKAGILATAPDMKLFTRPGPFAVDVIKDFDIRINRDEVVQSDLYLSQHHDRAPLVIIQHGNLGSKKVHRHQGERLASWGMHALVLSQPNHGRWLENGQVLHQLVKLLHRWPKLLDQRFDPNNIIVSGHSFGGSATAIAAGSGAPIKGIIFLDPALVNRGIRSNCFLPAAQGTVSTRTPQALQSTLLMA
jgi:pimeloyl-ACP methyl ester carboxylesterase